MARTIATLSIVVLLLAGCGGKKFALDEADAALVEARKAIADGDSAKAIELLDVSIAAKPDTWSYFERAKLLADSGDDEAAKLDITAGLEIEPEHTELLWLQKQLKKPKKSRYKGASGKPPSVSK